MAIPWLRHDTTWKNFLLPPSNVCISSLYGASDEYTDTKVENIGEQQIVSCLQRVEVPYKYTMSQRLEELKEEINNMEKYSKSINMLIFKST